MVKLNWSSCCVQEFWLYGGWDGHRSSSVAQVWRYGSHLQGRNWTPAALPAAWQFVRHAAKLPRSLLQVVCGWTTNGRRLSETCVCQRLTLVCQQMTCVCHRVTFVCHDSYTRQNMLTCAGLTFVWNRPIITPDFIFYPPRQKDIVEQYLKCKLKVSNKIRSTLRYC